jgi:hypothetical protein
MKSFVAKGIAFYLDALTSSRMALIKTVPMFTTMTLSFEDLD